MLLQYLISITFTSPTDSRTTTRTGLSALGGNNFTVDVAYSFKTKVINGSEVSTRYPLALTVTSKPSWVTNVAITTLSSDNGTYGLTLTLTENTVESTSSGTHKSIWILSILKPGRLHAKESRCSFIWFKLN